ncbi:MAG: CDC48 family AAA ATPase [archaeon]
MTVKLKVAESLQDDMGKGIARVDTKTRGQLGVSSGDIIKIKGKSETAARVWQAYPQDEDRGIIRMDGIVRQNAEASVGETVIIEKIDHVKETKELSLAPTKKVRFTGDFTEFARRHLKGRPLAQDDRIYISVWGQPLFFKVVKMKPKKVGRVTSNTNINILEETVEELAERPQVTYEDVGGLEEQVLKVREMIEFPLRHPELFKKIGIAPPKGVLLHGPPGTGKTLLAKAVANESDVYFTSIQGPEVVSKFVGQAEENLRKIFKNAKKNAPSIIFIDEIDAIASKRDEAVGEVEKRMVAQLLSLMDGMEDRGDVIVIGATNRPDTLDQALRRAGRFDREIEIGIPSEDERKEILQIHTRGMPLSDDVDLDQMAKRTHGFVGSDLEALAREAAMKTLRRLFPKIDLEEDQVPIEILENLKVKKKDFEEAFKEVQPSAMREVFVEKPNVSWSDIGGLEETKEKIKELIEWPIKYPEKFRELGIETPKGIFLYGPPGTGKTMLAKAVANETEANFILINGPELLNKYVGESEKSVREIFQKARQSAPCIIFFDEIDSIAPKRGKYQGSHVTESVVNQLLTEIDGLEELKDVMIIGATNRPDIVDPALLRPGRFNKMIETQAPDEEARKKILKVHTKNMPIEEDVELDEIASQTKNYSGADLAAIVQEAGINALRENRDKLKVTKEDFKKAVEEVDPSLKEVSMDQYKKFKGSYKGIEYA